MPIADILVFLDAEQPSASCLQVAASLAQRHGATLTGACARPIPEVAPADCYAIGPSAVADVLERESSAAEGAVLAARYEFQVAAKDHGVTALWVEFDCDPGLAAILARPYDLAILPHTQEGRMAAAFAETVTLASGTPCLLVPEEAGRKRFDQVVFAWDGGREAKRALQDALPILAAAKSVEVAAVTPGETARLEGPPVDAILRHLSDHQIQARFKALKGSAHDAGERLLAHCEESKADLLVVGAYGHLRITERVFGGTTRTLITKANLPIFVSH